MSFFGKSLLCLIIVFGHMVMKAQCDLSDIDFNSQTELDNFLVENPNCEQIDGIVRIRSLSRNDPITNLNGLQKIKSIKGGLDIFRNASLENLDGLSALEDIQGFLTIRDNPELKSITGISTLIAVNGNLTISDNPKLENLMGLQNVGIVLMTLTIEDNNSLVDLTGLGGLAILQGDFQIIGNENLASLNGLGTSLQNIRGNLTIRESPNLEEFEGLKNIQSIDGNVELAGLSRLRDLVGFTQLETIGGSFLIEELSVIESLIGLVNLKEIGSVFTIKENNSLKRLTGPALLNTLNTLIIESNPELLDLDGLDGLDEISVDVKIINNSKLSNLATDPSRSTGFERILGNLRIENNGALIELTGLSGLVVVNNLEIVNNGGLNSLDELDDLTINGRLTITGNTSLTKCDAESICRYLATTIGGADIRDNKADGNCITATKVLAQCNEPGRCPMELIIKRQSDLARFRADFPTCTSIPGDVKITPTNTNEIINDLSPLSNLEYIGGELSLSFVPDLTSLNGLHNLKSADKVFIQMDGIDDLEGLESLEVVTRLNLTVSRQLKSLKGIENLKSVRDLLIFNQPELTDISALRGLNPGGGTSFGHCE